MTDEIKSSAPPQGGSSSGGDRPAGGDRRSASAGERSFGGGDRRPPRPAAQADPAAWRVKLRRKKVCKFCVEKIDTINYKDVRTLAQFVAESGKIVPRR